ncbi:presenilin-associated rhomboid-like protein, mitochondrial [Diadema antillarum]|uniref:presenilin-associated rhomboid-like protein, mitochondrial n=1 Tax=Diadema antillarum TaxID=105358 RepID=UPI003A8B7297
MTVIMFARGIFSVFNQNALSRSQNFFISDVRLMQLRSFKKAPSGSGNTRTALSGKRGKKNIINAKFDKGQVEQFNVVYEDTPQKLPFSRLGRPFVFACAFTGCAFAGSAIWQYEGARTRALSRLRQRYSGFFEAREHKRGELRDVLNQWYSQLTGTQKVVLGIVVTNIAVFAFWRIPAMQHFMIHWFSANPAASATCLPMILSVFSHYSLWHLGINMYVLWSFSSSIGSILGKEQFLAMYLSAGVWASFASYALKIATSRFNPSLGASGAIMAVLGSVCIQFPDARLAIIFLPFVTFSASTALTALIGLESMGVILGWQVFDHAAHLAGLLFGCYYVKHGHEMMWDGRERYLQKWHNWRGKPQDV